MILSRSQSELKERQRHLEDQFPPTEESILFRGAVWHLWSASHFCSLILSLGGSSKQCPCFTSLRIRAECAGGKRPRVLHPCLWSLCSLNGGLRSLWNLVRNRSQSGISSSSYLGHGIVLRHSDACTGVWNQVELRSLRARQGGSHLKPISGNQVLRRNSVFVGDPGSRAGLYNLPQSGASRKSGWTSGRHNSQPSSPLWWPFLS